MRLGKVIFEEKVPGNLERREQLGLPWLSYFSDRVDLGQAIAEAEEETGLDVKVGLWKGRRPPEDVVLIGRYIGDRDDAELPLYVIPARHAKGPVPPATPAAPAAPAANRIRLAKDERVLVKVAARIIRMERQFVLFKWLAVFSLLVSLITAGAVVMLLLWR